MAAKIQESAQYDRFELLAFNRDVRKLKPLERSMRQYGWIDAYPMHVVKNGGGRFKIKAGHHRFTVARKIGIPVKYVVCDDGGVTIHELEESTSRWTLKDFLTSYVRCGMQDYVTIKEYHQETGITLSVCVSMMGGESAASNNKQRAFKTGTFRLGDTTHAYTVGDMVMHCKAEGVSFARNTAFVKALSKIAFVDQFDPEVFKHKVSTHPELLSKQRSKDDYAKMIEEVYNFKSRNKTPLVFLANQDASERSAVQRSYE